MKFKTHEDAELHNGAVMARQALREGWPLTAAKKKTMERLIKEDDAMMKRYKAAAPKKPTKK